MANLKELLTGKLSSKEISLVPSSFDIVGTKVIFSRFPDELISKQKLIGRAILENFHQVDSVFRKSKKYSGKYRTPTLKWIAGSRSRETTYKEHGISLKFDVEKVYFSPRLGNERKRIFEMVRPNESVLCLFSGCGVYPLVIAKNAKPREVHGIELNPLAHKYALENLKINKMQDRILLLKGDVRTVLPKLDKKFDRIVMPLPTDAEHFLDVILPKARKNGFVHFYCFGTEEDVIKLEKAIISHCKAFKKKCTILKKVVCGHFGPKIHRWCIDFRVG